MDSTCCLVLIQSHLMVAFFYDSGGGLAVVILLIKHSRRVKMRWFVYFVCLCWVCCLFKADWGNIGSNIYFDIHPVWRVSRPSAVAYLPRVVMAMLLIPAVCACGFRVLASSTAVAHKSCIATYNLWTFLHVSILISPASTVFGDISNRKQINSNKSQIVLRTYHMKTYTRDKL